MNKIYNKFKEELLNSKQGEFNSQVDKNEEGIRNESFVTNPKKYKETFPIIQKTLDVILEMKNKGYKLFILSNITKESFEYLKSRIEIEKNFNGGVYSFQEGMRKPSEEFYEVLIKKYNLKKEECIFFDDKQKNVEVGNSLGIKSIKFNTVEDIKNNLI